MIKILGRANSLNVQKVMWCAAELGLDVDRSDVGGPYGGTDTPEYGALNPNRTIPTLVDDEFVLWESNVIVRYLCEAYGSAPLLPDSIQRNYLANQWMDWYVANLHEHMTVLFLQTVRTAPDKIDRKAIEAATQRAHQLWQILEKHLEERPYILGDELTMADIPLGCAAYRWHVMDIERPSLPNLKRWWDSLTERPNYQKHVMIPLS